MTIQNFGGGGGHGYYILHPNRCSIAKVHYITFRIPGKRGVVKRIVKLSSELGVGEIFYQNVMGGGMEFLAALLADFEQSGFLWLDVWILLLGSFGKWHTAF